MPYHAVGHKLPRLLSVPLFGDRGNFGSVPVKTDPCWLEWEKRYLDFYYNNQKSGIGDVVNNAGYRIMSQVDLTNKKILEIGPGDIRHIPFWNGRPELYVIADINRDMLDRSASRLVGMEISCRQFLLTKECHELPFMDGEFDIVVSFYSLEHLYPLKDYLDQFLRVIKPGGLLVGAIPCEGGIAWGLGRFLTSRRWLKKNTNIDPDKIICWEHPNFADFILNEIDQAMECLKKRFWPIDIPSVDLNLIASFIYAKK